MVSQPAYNNHKIETAKSSELQANRLPMARDEAMLVSSSGQLILLPAVGSPDENKVYDALRAELSTSRFLLVTGSRADNSAASETIQKRIIYWIWQLQRQDRFSTNSFVRVLPQPIPGKGDIWVYTDQND